MTTLAPSPATAISTPTVRRTPFARLVVVELRKSVDTRAGAVLLGLVALLTLAPVGWQLTHLDHGVPDFGLWASTARGGVALLVPVIGILAMTGEWSQRTALTTFTLVPRRGRVVAAKLVAAALLGAATMAFALGTAALALVVAAAGHDVTPQWGDAGRVVAGSLVSSGLNLLMGAAFGALLALRLFPRRRGRSQFPQYLHRGRYDEVRRLWLSHGVPTFVARKLEATTNPGGWHAF